MNPELVVLPARFAVPRRRYERLHTEADGSAGPLRHATSVMLVRDRPGDGALEVFVLRRVAEMSFAGGMTVFPGGGVDDRDRDPADRAGEPATDGPSSTTLRRAAVRETFEETGVLYAGPTPTTMLADTTGLSGARSRLASHETDLTTVLAASGLVARADLLVPWARWITPELMPVRYDTRFFVAAVPPGQEPDGDTSEAADAGWCTPAAALAAWSDGERTLMPPTWAVLSELGERAEGADVATVLAAATDRDLRPVLPQFVDDRSEGTEEIRMGVPRHALATRDQAALGGTPWAGTP